MTAFNDTLTLADDLLSLSSRRLGKKTLQKKCVTKFSTFKEAQLEITATVVIRYLVFSFYVFILKPHKFFFQLLIHMLD